MADREFVVLDSLDSYDDVKLADVIGALESEAAEALSELREELQRRTLAALERAAKAGVVLNSKPPAADGDAAKAKRGRKSAEEKAAIEAAKSKAAQSSLADTPLADSVDVTVVGSAE